MLFIIPGILLIGSLCLVIWAAIFRAALAHERMVKDARARAADFEKRLETPGELLFCVACREGFRAPIPANGCPQCHTRAFIVPACVCDDPRAQRVAVPVTIVGAQTPSEKPVESSPVRVSRRRVVRQENKS